MRTSTNLRKAIAIMGTQATLFSVSEGSEDTFGDPTFTFSQTTITVLPVSEGTDEDYVQNLGRQHQERRQCFAMADETVVPGDELYVDDTTKRYRIRGVTDVIFHGEVSFRRLFLEEMAGALTET